MFATRIRAIAAVLAIGAAGPAHSQAVSTAALRSGERVRFTAQYQGDVVGCAGRIASFAGDTLVVDAITPCAQALFPRASLREVEVARADHGSRLAHTGLGLLVGTVAGGVVGRLAAGDGCTVDGCDDGGLAIAVMTIGGMGLGALIGTVIGAALPAGVEWRATGTVTAIRLAFQWRP